jgi:hypothetical protein
VQAQGAGDHDLTAAHSRDRRHEGAVEVLLEHDRVGAQSHDRALRAAAELRDHDHDGRAAVVLGHHA